MRRNCRKLKAAVFGRFRYQYEAAEAAGIKEARLSFLVSGRNEATAEERAALARVLGVAEQELFEQEETAGALQD